MTLLRIGIFAGTFDPVHAGHIAAAKQAIRAAQLDEVVFLPERTPRFKPGAEHYAHRLAMLKTALAPYDNLSVGEVVERRFTVRRTLHALQNRFPGAQLVFIMGSDTAALVPTWQNVNQLLATCELVVAVRHPLTFQTVRGMIAGWPQLPVKATITPAAAPHMSSTAVRAALRARMHTRGLLTSVGRYARRQWLYVSLRGRS